MSLDLSFLFRNVPDFNANVTPMEFPFLINYAFLSGQDNSFQPDSLNKIMHRICQMVAKRTEPEELKDRMVRNLRVVDSVDGWPNGFFGTDNFPIREIINGEHPTYIHVGMTGARLYLRRYGSSLGLKPMDGRDKPHEEMTEVLAELASEVGQLDVREFIYRYSFTVTPELTRTSGFYVVNMSDELMVMSRYLPDIKWGGSKRLATELSADFTSRERDGVKVGSYGDATIFARIRFQRELDDQDWRQGKVRPSTGNDLAFGTSDTPQVEYFVRTIADTSPHRDSPTDIDYNHEQYVLRQLAQMLYAGLCQRARQDRVKNGNLHLIRFRKSEAAASPT